MWFASAAYAQTVFSVDKIVDWKRDPRKNYVNSEENYGIYEDSKVEGRRVLKFIPSVEAQVSVGTEIEGSKVFARAYFFDPNKRLVGTAPAPARAFLHTGNAFGMPGIFPKGRPQSLFFPAPPQWSAQGGAVVVVFGDKSEAAARAYPDSVKAGMFDYPERRLAEGFQGNLSRPAAAANAAPSVIEYVAKTRSLQQPQITLFFKLPAGVKKISELRGILGQVVVGAGVNDVRQQFLKTGGNPRPGSLDELAQKYKLGLLTWGAHTLWNKRENADELSPEQRRAEEGEFDLVADGWEKGVEDLVKLYGIPNTKMLLAGASQAGQWSHRLALRKPDRILAVHAHIASSYDVPTPAGARTLWLITTGEQESGAEHALDFYEGCRKLGYPMILKIEPGLGHEASALANRLEYQFFKYVLDHASPLGSPTAPALLEGFQRPAFLGDVSDQDVAAPAEADEIEPENRVPLPTREIAEAWAGHGIEPQAAGH
ncbi:MAG: hypothetical protein PHC88_15745 [Terrimicrobiaceae bacterium]|nr:hypothetical protein [Terrimicrobiaceae bacterium]